MVIREQLNFLYHLPPLLKSFLASQLIETRHAAITVQLLWLFLPQYLYSSTHTPPGCGCLMPQIDPEAMDDGSGALGDEKLWHQQALVTGAEHMPLGAGAGGGAAGGNVDDATVKVGALVLSMF